MLISITKSNGRNILLCTRANGSTTRANLGPDFPYHDIAHYVVEQQMGFTKAFYALIAQGHSIDELSTTAMIRSLEREAMVSEVMTRALQSLSSGACRQDQYIDLVSAELQEDTPAISQQDVTEMYTTFMKLFAKWNALPEGESLTMHFTTTTTAA